MGTNNIDARDSYSKGTPNASQITGENLDADKRAIHTKAPGTEDKLDDVISALGGGKATPTIYNEGYAVANVIQSRVLSSGTKEFTIKHRERGRLDVGFVSGLTTYVTLRRAEVYTEKGTTISSVTIYFRSPTVGTVEIIEWT